jgi:hypothetical protein
MTPEKLYKLGMKPWAPRWLKLWCLRMILRHVARELQRRIDSLTPEQRDALNAASGKIEA